MPEKRKIFCHFDKIHENQYKLTNILSFILAQLDIPINAKWIQNGITIAGGNGQGNEVNQLYYPRSLYIDDDQTIYVADESNHRIVE